MLDHHMVGLNGPVAHEAPPFVVWKKPSWPSLLGGPERASIVPALEGSAGAMTTSHCDGQSSLPMFPRTAETPPPLVCLHCAASVDL
jgi:hypothetical protein